MIAALYVETGGAYFGLPDVDPWDEARDARLYPGPWSVVAHPPCARWCVLADFVESRHPHLRKGDDGGTFAAALAAVQKWGGVLEHPARTSAWRAHGLPEPPAFGWVRVFGGKGWACEVSQAPYGHPAPKLTWLYYEGDAPPPPLDWSRPRLQHATKRRPKGVEMQSRAERIKTPPRFRELLLSLARGARSSLPGWRQWVDCPCCESPWCVMHERHAFECTCPAMGEE